VEGDFEALMADAGVSWTVRKLAKGAGYGAGMVRHDIRLEGDRLAIVFKTRPGKIDELAVRLGVADQGTLNEDGTPIRVFPRWEGDALCMSGTQEDTGATMQSTRRYLVGEELVCESMTSTGLVVKRFFTRC
jgi:hypothetical protein